MLQMTTCDKPRERLKQYGAKALSNQELLAIILRTGYKNQDVIKLANQVLTKCESLVNLQNMMIEELCLIPGIGEVKAIEILAAIEFGKRIIQTSCKERKRVQKTSDIGDEICQMIGGCLQEHVLVVCLNTKNEIIKIEEIAIGSINESLVHPREVFNLPIRLSAAKIILAHNHPSGHLEPSRADLDLTKKLKECGDLLGIPLIDHVIVSRTKYLSIFYYTYKKS